MGVLLFIIEIQDSKKGALSGKFLSNMTAGAPNSIVGSIIDIKSGVVYFFDSFFIFYFLVFIILLHRSIIFKEIIQKMAY